MDSDFLLNFLLTLAIDNANYSNFDGKSKKFVEDCLDYVEEQFAGTHKFNVKADPIVPNGKPRVISMFRLKPIASNPMSYNKTLTYNKNSSLDGIETDQDMDDERDNEDDKILDDDIEGEQKTGKKPQINMDRDDEEIIERGQYATAGPEFRDDEDYKIDKRKKYERGVLDKGQN